ncbi:uncharacterized protein IUM83_13077 [Phytophthora cinnamomi]|uniref:uncharacterized protein n=1 Tax=Phytophthora cinnamomi TaxID=4785 RepID=UPI0035596692|nr:hypothetical protein IUM83_13077 [Phytophthora cinnamomi]
MPTNAQLLAEIDRLNQAMAERTRVPSNLPKFTGNRGDDVREWLFQIQNACRINGIQIDDASVRLSAMEKPASGWFLHWSSTTRSEEYTWRLSVSMCSNTSKRRTTRPSCVRSFNDSSSRRISRPTTASTTPIFRVEGMSVLDQVLSYTNGLKSRTRSYVKLENPKTLSEAMDLAVKYEVMHFVEDVRDRPSHRLEESTNRRKENEDSALEVSWGDLPDFCRGAALETDVKLKVETAGDAVQKEKTLSVVRGQQEDAQAGKDSAGQSGVATSKRESTARATDESSGTRGKDTVVEMMFTMGLVDESGVQTKYITRKKPRKFLRIKTKKIDEPDLMLVLSIETIKQVVRSLQRCDEPDNVGSAKARRNLETDWDTFLENSAFDLLTGYKDNVFRSELPEGLPEKREIEYRIGVKDPNLAM